MGQQTVVAANLLSRQWLTGCAVMLAAGASAIAGDAIGVGTGAQDDRGVGCRPLQGADTRLEGVLVVLQAALGRLALVGAEGQKDERRVEPRQLRRDGVPVPA